jgi:hypothetical protein
MNIKLTSVYVDDQEKALRWASTIAMLNDTCGNLIQLTQLARY